MRAQCSICWDLFENSPHINIAAVQCGHTFHEHCLMRWLESTSTCPSCRKQIKKNQIIKRLFFDIEVDDDDVETGDPDKLVNEINTLRAQISEHEATQKNITAAKDTLSQNLAQCLAAKDAAETSNKQQRKDILSVRQQLTLAQEDKGHLVQQLSDFEATRRRLNKLQQISLVLEGSEDDVSGIVENFTEVGGANIQRLSSMVVLVKREYNKALTYKKSLRDNIKKHKTSNMAHQDKINKLKQGIKAMQSQLHDTNEEVFRLERENNEYRRKIAHLRSAINHNKVEGSQSFIAAITEDSPNVTCSPPPSTSTSGNCGSITDSQSAMSLTTQSREEQLILSPDLFNDSFGDESKTQSTVSLNSQWRADPPQLKMVRLTSEAEKFQAAKRAKIESEREAAPSFPTSNFSIINNRNISGQSTSHPSVLSKLRAYDGLGGSVAYVEPSDTPLSGRVRPDPRKNKTKRRCPLAPKQPQNQPKLKDCIFSAKCKPECAPSSAKHHSDDTKSHPVETMSKEKTKKQPMMFDIFRKSLKTTSSGFSLSSSKPLCSTPKDVIDLT